MSRSVANPPLSQAGFGAIVAIVVVVALAALGTAILKFGWGQQMASAMDIDSARAWQAARAGSEWGLYRALRGDWSACVNASDSLDLRADGGFIVRVSCDSRQYVEGEESPGVPARVRVYEIRALACNAGTCPDDARATRPGYVERERLVLATDR